MQRKRPVLVGLAFGCFLVGAYALVRNLLSTWQTLDRYPNAQFWQVFFSTQSPTGGVEPMFLFYVWGPLVFAILGVVLLGVHLGIRAIRSGAPVAVGAGTAAAASQQWGRQSPDAQAQPWQQAQQPWQQDASAQQQPTWQQQPAADGTQPPPPNASDRIQP